MIETTSQFPPNGPNSWNQKKIKKRKVNDLFYAFKRDFFLIKLKTKK